jgi:hypothetical protein
VDQQDLDEAMKRSTAKWKIAVGHHTMRSVSDHGDTADSCFFRSSRLLLLLLF